jgi:hypothetical protein
MITQHIFKATVDSLLTAIILEDGFMTRSMSSQQGFLACSICVKGVLFQALGWGNTQQVV